MYIFNFKKNYVDDKIFRISNKILNFELKVKVSGHKSNTEKETS